MTARRDMLARAMDVSNGGKMVGAVMTAADRIPGLPEVEPGRKSRPVQVRFSTPILSRVRDLARFNGLSTSSAIRVATVAGLDAIDRGEHSICRSPKPEGKG